MEKTSWTWNAHPKATRRASLASVLFLSIQRPVPSRAASWKDVQGTVMDDTLSYRFTYPTKDANEEGIAWTFSRTPKAYLSASPLSVDARQRVVCEMVDLKRALAMAVVVGPTPARWKDVDGKASPKRVANSILTERSTARVTSGQRIALASVEDSELVELDGSTYYWYEYVSQGAPTAMNPSAETYRRSIASTSERDGYVYTFSLSAPDESWDVYVDGFLKARDSFRLLEPGRSYVAPDQWPLFHF